MFMHAYSGLREYRIAIAVNTGAVSPVSRSSPVFWFVCFVLWFAFSIIFIYGRKRMTVFPLAVQVQ